MLSNSPRMKSLKLLCVALMDTAIGLLTFNLSMSRVPHSACSAKLTVGVTAFGAVLQAIAGNMFPALLMSLTSAVVAIDHGHRKAQAMRLIDEPSRVVAIAYVIGMASIISSFMLIGAGLTLPQGLESWFRGITSLWMLMVLVTMLPSIERHQAALLAATMVLASSDDPSEPPGVDVPESKQP